MLLRIFVITGALMHLFRWALSTVRGMAIGSAQWQNFVIYIYSEKYITLASQPFHLTVFFACEMPLQLDIAHSNVDCYHQQQFKRPCFRDPWYLLPPFLIFRCPYFSAEHLTCAISKLAYPSGRAVWGIGLAPARYLGLPVRIPLGACVSVCCECCVLSGRGLCDGLITRPESPVSLWACLWVRVGG